MASQARRLKRMNDKQLKNYFDKQEKLLVAKLGPNELKAFKDEVKLHKKAQREQEQNGDNNITN